MSYNTLVFMGGPLRRHGGMIGENLIDYSMNLTAWLVPSGLFFQSRWKLPSARLLYVLWIAPSVIMILGIHSGRVGHACNPSRLSCCFARS